MIQFLLVGCFLQVLFCEIAFQNAQKCIILQKADYYANIIIQMMQFVNGFFAKNNAWKNFLYKMMTNFIRQTARTSAARYREREM